MLNAIGAAALGLLIVNPQVLFGASFQLTFLCVWLVAAVGIPILERTTQPFVRGSRNIDSMSYDFVLPAKVAQFRLDLRMIAGRLQRYVGRRWPLPVLAVTARMLLGAGELLLISVVMQIGLALPMAYYFHRATVVGLPANMLVVPLMELLMPAAVAAMVLGYVSHTLAKIPVLIAGFALEGIASTVRWLGGLRIADLRVPTPGTAVILFSALAIALAMGLVRRRSWMAAGGLAALVASALWISAVAPRPRLRPAVLEMTAIDVGQGDSILLVSPTGRALLVDAGGLPRWVHSDLDIGEDVVSPYLWSRAISRLDAVAITHAHADHMGGAAAILANFRPHELWLSEPSNPEMKALVHQAQELGGRVVRRRAGDEFDFGGAEVRILAPGAQDPAARRNDESLVMKLVYEKTSALLEGDAEKRSEQQVAAEHPEADLLKVAHHGSATSTIPLLLDRVHPRFAVISVGARNTYGHPRGEVLRRLGEAHVNDLPHRSRRRGHVLFGRHHRHPWSSSGGSPLISISAVSSLPGAWRYSSITRLARSASSSRTRIIVPPTPGRMSCWASMDVMSESIPVDSSRPCTTMASDSCSVSKTRTSFSLGLGRAAGRWFIAPPIRAAGGGTNHIWISPLRSSVFLGTQ